MLNAVLALVGALVGALPGAVEWTVATALGREPPRTSERAASPTVPIVAAALIALGVMPLVFAGLELIIHRTTAADLVDRVTGPSLQLVELNGLAQLPPLPAPPRRDGTATRFYLVRDEAAARDLVAVRSDVPPEELQVREVTAVIVEDPPHVRADAAALAARGLPVDPAELGGRYLREEPRMAGAADVAVSDLAEHPAGTAVRIRLRFSRASVATCASTGAAACDARTLAAGRAEFDHLAADPSSGAPVIVRTDHPATLAPIHVFGSQRTDRGPVDALFATPAGAVLGTWGRELHAAWVDGDADLPVDRPWSAPALLLAAGTLLITGRRVGYPIFRSTARWASSPRIAGDVGREIRVAVSGHLSRPAGGPLDVDGAHGRLSPGEGDTIAELAVTTPSGPVHARITRAMGAVSALEVGELIDLRGRRPALAAHWFGNDIVLGFSSLEERDRAARLLAG